MRLDAAEVQVLVDRLHRSRGQPREFLDACDMLMDAVSHHYLDFDVDQRKKIDDCNSLLGDLQDMFTHSMGLDKSVLVVDQKTRYDGTIRHVLRWLDDDFIFEEIMFYWRYEGRYPPLFYFFERHIQGIFHQKLLLLQEKSRKLLSLLASHASRRQREDHWRQIGGDELPTPVDVLEVENPAPSPDFFQSGPVLVSEDIPETESMPVEEKSYEPIWDKELMGGQNSFYKFISLNMKMAKEQGFEVSRPELEDYYKKNIKNKKNVSSEE